MKMLLSPLPFPLRTCTPGVMLPAVTTQSTKSEQQYSLIIMLLRSPPPFGFVLERCPTLFYFLCVCVYTPSFFLYTLFIHSLLEVLFYSLCVCVCILILPFFFTFSFALYNIIILFISYFFFFFSSSSLSSNIFLLTLLTPGCQRLELSTLLRMIDSTLASSIRL